jgi:hypothetical protein
MAAGFYSNDTRYRFYEFIDGVPAKCASHANRCDTFCACGGRIQPYRTCVELNGLLYHVSCAVAEGFIRPGYEPPKSA